MPAKWTLDAAIAEEICEAATEVVEFDWRTSVSERYHFRRVAAMQRLRNALSVALPPVADKDKEAAHVTAACDLFAEGQKILKERQK